MAFAAALLSTGAWLFALVPSAAAQGGATVEGAPYIESGQTQQGDTAEVKIEHGLPDGTCGSDEQLWRLNLTAGDTVLLKGRLEAPAEDFSVAAMPPGVTDATLAGGSQIAGSQTGNLENGLSFAAGRSGTWLVAVGSCDGRDGPYQLTATVYPGPFVVEEPGGGNTVEGAPSLTSGNTFSGDTDSETVIGHGLPDGTCGSDEQLWALNLTAGDTVLLKGRLEAPAEDFSVAAMPPGVTDATLAGNSQIAGSQTGNLENGLSFAAGRSGTWLVAVGSCDGHDGPYQLTATVYPGSFVVQEPGGGNTVESAPSLASANTFSGDTDSETVLGHGLPDGTCGSDEQLWALNLTAGDTVLLKGRLEAPAEDFSVAAMPPGVTDATLAGNSQIAGSETGNLENGLSFAAGRSGTWLVAVGSCNGHDGPYQITATVTPPPPSPPPPTSLPPHPSLYPSIAITASKLAVSEGVVPVHVTCQTAKCSGTIELTEQIVVRHRNGGKTVTRKTLVLASAPFSLAAGQSETVRLELTRTGKKLLAHARRHHVAMRLVVRVNGAATTTKAVVVS